MSITIEQGQIEGIVIFDLKGQLTLGENDSKLRDTLAVFGHLCKASLVLNLKGVDRIDSGGLGLVVFALARLAERGGRLALSIVNPEQMKLFLLTKLAQAFEFCAGDHDTVDRFYPDRAIHSFDVPRFVRQQECHGAAR